MKNEIQRKNQCIAEMLGYENIPKDKHPLAYQNYGIWKKGVYFDEIDARHNSDWLGFVSDLKYNSDANWQFNVIDWIEKLSGGNVYIVRIEGNKCEIFISTQFALAYDEHLSIFKSEKNKIKAIFEALYQFSIYLKQKNG